MNLNSLRQVTLGSAQALDHLGGSGVPESAANAVKASICCKEEQELVLKSHDLRKRGCAVLVYL